MRRGTALQRKSMSRDADHGSRGAFPQILWPIPDNRLCDADQHLAAVGLPCAITPAGGCGTWILTPCQEAR